VAKRGRPSRLGVMIVVGVILASFLLFNGIWWRWADGRLRVLRRRRRWRTILSLFMLLQMLCFLVTLLSRRYGVRPPLVPVWMLGAMYVWHLLVAPGTMGVLCVGTAGAWLWKAGRLLIERSGGRNGDCDDAREQGLNGRGVGDGPSRRQMLLGAAVAIPPMLNLGCVAVGVVQIATFRLRRLTVTLPNLPAALDGFTIMHISDVHNGAFTPARTLAAIADRTNALKPDLVVMTGDLIDYALGDLKAPLDMLRGIESRFGLFVCEGNHDLFMDRYEFESRVRAAGVPLLLNESRLIWVNGQAVQVMGLKYGIGRSHAPMIEQHMSHLLAVRHADAFPILLAHHPHAFDLAVEAGIPLTLSGHTHGGQLMLTKNTGAGPLLFGYWSGLYERNGCVLVVSNGVGNWFPLRINAPAEIGHVTLRRG